MKIKTYIYLTYIEGLVPMVIIYWGYTQLKHDNILSLIITVPAIFWLVQNFKILTEAYDADANGLKILNNY